MHNHMNNPLHCPIPLHLTPVRCPREARAASPRAVVPPVDLVSVH